MKSFQKCGEVGGGILRTETFVHSQTIASGQTGDLVVIGTAGKITELLALYTDTATNQSGISVDVDGTILIGPDILSDISPFPASGFYVSKTAIANITDIRSGLGAMYNVIGEFITIRKNAGNTTQDLRYSYATVVIK